jgi:hypothetical protein
MITIQLHIPDDLANKVQSLTGNTEKFILDLLRSKVNEPREPLTLADEYRLAGKENSKLMSDFAHSDLEGWDDEY